jgi:hypothetical protein
MEGKAMTRQISTRTPAVLHSRQIDIKVPFTDAKRWSPIKYSGKILVTLVTALAAVIMAAAPSFSENLAVKSCAELVRMAQSYQQDLKTVDTVLGSAIDAGNLDRIRSYKLRKATVKRQLKSVLRTIDLKNCAAQK